MRTTDAHRTQHTVQFVCVFCGGAREKMRNPEIQYVHSANFGTKNKHFASHVSRHYAKHARHAENKLICKYPTSYQRSAENISWNCFENIKNKNIWLNFYSTFLVCEFLVSVISIISESTEDFSRGIKQI